MDLDQGLASARPPGGAGVRRVSLNVFGVNAVARQLYESSGYEVSSLHMHKPLAR